MKEKVLVALSGGIDSAMTAWTLMERGYEVQGIHFHFFDKDAGAAQDSLNFLSDKLGIAIEIFDARAEFDREVVEYLLSMHMHGKTPSPCAICNPRVKWKLLAEIAVRNHCDHYATGHYVRIAELHHQKRIFRGADRLKDQSYYLWGISNEILRNAMTPLGETTKEQVRELAAKAGFKKMNRKKESMGLCFSDHTHYNDFLREQIGNENIGPGEVFDRKGNYAGTHQGYPYYTIGQKKDLSLNEPYLKWCVAEIHPSENRLVVDRWQDLYASELTIGQYHFFDEEEIHDELPIQVKVRGFGLNPGSNCKLTSLPSGLIHVALEEPAWAIAPGQPVVFYSGDLLLGGGIAV